MSRRRETSRRREVATRGAWAGNESATRGQEDPPTPAPPGARGRHPPGRTLAGTMSDIVSDSVGPSEAGAWLSLEDAARFLHVTVRTVDRRGLPKRRLPGQPTEVWVAGAD